MNYRRLDTRFLDDARLSPDPHPLMQSASEIRFDLLCRQIDQLPPSDSRFHVVSHAAVAEVRLLNPYWWLGKILQKKSTHWVTVNSSPFRMRARVLLSLA